MTASLPKALRTQLENTVKTAREIAEQAAGAALAQLAVGEGRAPDYLSESQRALRRRLRAHGRALGDLKAQNETQGVRHLVWEVAYQHWHRMLFARFLAESGLLLWEPGAPVSLDDCREMVDNHPDLALGARSQWELAGRLAARMLPQVFKPRSPVFELSFAPEHQRELERLLGHLPVEVFWASDSLGWVYQFWQAKRKDEVNASEVKIGADELPAVTQLFTEPYMVDFLLHNSLGAWWVTRWPDRPCPVPLTYLRTHAVEAASSRFQQSQETRQDGASTYEDLWGYFKRDEPIANLSGNLPHWRQDGVTYFVTFRCADSLPQDRLQAWLQEREEWLRQHPKPHDDQTRHEYQRRFTTRIEQWLDQGYGECLLAIPEYRVIVENALRHFDGERYHLGEFVVMPNHVHVVVTPLPGHQLSDILHSWKSFTATQINKRIGKSGAFWQKESFDHIVRGPTHLERINQYIRDNPKRLTTSTNCSTMLVEAASSRLSTSQDISAAEKRLEGASTPAAGRFEGWPESLADFRLVDPCCGSGHFLVAAFLLLVPMRMVAEELSAAEAVDAVLRDNLHGLELDARCVEIAVFALALAAWRYPDANGDPLGVRAEMPAPRIACCGLKVAARPEDWVALVPEDAPHSAHLREGLRRLHETFQQAPLLGSLLDPGRAHEGDLFAPDYEILKDLLQRALRTEQQYSLWDETDAIWDYALSAQGLLEAAQLLEARYHLVITNVPYLARGKQSEALKTYCERHYPEAKNDLANVFLERCLELCVDAASSRVNTRQDGASTGVVQIVMPQNWLFLTSYRKQRERLLKRVHFNLVALLGPKGFQTPMWDFNVQLLTMTHAPAADGFDLRGVDASAPKSATEKAALLREGELVAVSQKGQLRNPDARIALGEASDLPLLDRYARSFQGIKTGDDPRYRAYFWELFNGYKGWVHLQSTVEETVYFSGLESLLRWDKEGNELARRQGIGAWNLQGVAVSQMSKLPVALYFGGAFDSNVSPITPLREDLLPAIWCFCSSPDYQEHVRNMDQKVAVANATLVKVPFDLAHWQQVAAERYPNGLPKPYSDDPTQWLFHGHPQPATDPLQVAVARLLGYRWPAESSTRVEAASSRLKTRQDGASTPLELADEARAWIARCQRLEAAATQGDGILCLPSVRGEKPAHERLLDLLIAAWETVQPGSWKPSVLDSLLADAAGPGKSLETWLRDSFFEQHARRFHHRPFIWHVWDGLKDGFGALVNVHTLDAKRLERLIHTYLGDWIRQQEVEAASSRLDARQDGASTRLAAAQHLKRRLELILEGEAPYDIFVRWKPLAEQPIGWNPDLNDGVRLNIRPFMTAEVLRHNKKPKLNIDWKKDRGKDVESAPWFPVFQGERINDHHLTLAEKRAARGSST